jgi:hypothetical protein
MQPPRLALPPRDGKSSSKRRKEVNAMKALNQTVRGVLARHLGRPPSSIHAWQDLEADLDMTPLELVLVVLEVEEILDSPLPVEDLPSLRTVGDSRCFSRAQSTAAEGLRRSPTSRRPGTCARCARSVAPSMRFVLGG